MATYSLKLSTENCGQTAADRDMVTINNKAVEALIFLTH